MADDLLGKEVTVQFEQTEVVSRTGVVVADDDKGVLLRRPYRKGVRLELVPREQIRGVFHEVEKGPRRKKGAGVRATPAEEPEDADDFDDSDGLDDGDDTDFDDLPDTNWDDDDE